MTCDAAQIESFSVLAETKVPVCKQAKALFMQNSALK